MSVVRIALRDIVTDGMVPMPLIFPGIKGIGIVGSSIIDRAAIFDVVTGDARFPCKCIPWTVFCQ